MGTLLSWSGTSANLVAPARPCHRRNAYPQARLLRLASPHCYDVPVPKQKQKQPKKKCCVDKPRCKRCPIRMLAEDTLPEGYTVKKRKLVKADGKKRLPKAA